MKIKFLLLFFLLTIFSMVFAEIETPEVVKKTGVSVIVLSSLERLLQNEVIVQGAKEAEIFCAKNEYESFQIIIADPTDEPVPNINLKFGNWQARASLGGDF